MRGNKYVPFMLKRGDGRTLDLDFTRGVLDSRITFTRASTATFIGSNGLVQTMAAAPTNDPTKARFDHDPSTLAPRGLLVEGQATNLLNWSEAFATSGGTNNNWGDTNITRTSTNNTDPAGGTTALRITASAGNGTIISSAAIGTSAARTFSVWLRRVTGTGDIQYTQNNGTNYTTQAITSSWVRYTFTHTANHQVGIRIVTSGDAIELWGAQLETGSGASSYIPTDSSQATRVAEQGEMPFDAATFGYGTSPNHTFSIGWNIAVNASSGFPNAVALQDATTNKTAQFTVNTSTPPSHFSAWSVTSGTLTTASIASQAIGVNRKLAASVTDGSLGHNLSINGTAATPQAVTSAVLRLPTRLMIPGAGDRLPSVHLQFVRFWPYAFTSAQLNAITQ